ncbi:MAG TPA: nucleotidyltransferase family protein [Methylophilaceae bacterium]|jgi:MurNAc alpha-1-phosphate uridylyltransferase
MKAMILAAGRGERMRPLTDHTPKPLLEVGGKPLIVWHLERLAASGFREVVINHAHLGAQIESRLGNGANWGLSIQYSAEVKALETAGGITKALPLLGEQPFLVINGDIYTDINFADLKSVLAEDKLAHLVLIDNPPQHAQGDFAFDHQQLALEGMQMLTFSGVGVYHPTLFAEVSYGQPAKLAPILREAITLGRVTAEHYQGLWHDVGTPERLYELDQQLKANNV